MEKVSILGAGNWGTAIANIIAANGVKTVLYTNEETCVREINEKHTNTKYAPMTLSDNISASADLGLAVKDTDHIFIILPSSVVRIVLEKLKSVKVNFKHRFVIFTKGMDATSQKFFNDVVVDFFPDAEIAILAGPNFAEEVLEKKATTTTVACKNRQYFNELERILNCDFFKINYFDDPKAVQLCGLVKNVLAILCGVSEGLDLGKNTFAALMMRGIGEIEMLCKKLACNELVITTAAGIGDIVLTCSSTKSRNMSFGFKIGSGENIKNILSNPHSTIEGLLNAKTLLEMSKKLGIDNSLANTVLDIVNNEYSKEELRSAIVKSLFN